MGISHSPLDLFSLGTLSPNVSFLYSFYIDISVFFLPIIPGLLFPLSQHSLYIYLLSVEVATRRILAMSLVCLLPSAVLCLLSSLCNLSCLSSGVSRLLYTFPAICKMSCSVLSPYLSTSCNFFLMFCLADECHDHSQPVTQGPLQYTT